MDYELLSKIYYREPQNFDNIYKSRFNSESTIRYDVKIGEHVAFVVINSEILNLINEILVLDKELFRLSITLPSIALTQFIKKCLVDEIKLTNEIEGVYSTRREINELFNEIKSEKNESKSRMRFYGLVQKYYMLLGNENIGLSTCQDIRNIYNDLVLQEIKEEEPKNMPDGDVFRKEGVEVLSTSQKVIHQGVMPEAKIMDYMTKALNILNNKASSFLINIAVFHYLFGYIHPFYDGNGRVSRFISSHKIAEKLEKITAFGLSYTIKQNLNKYYKSFKYTNDSKNCGELTGFVIEFLEIIKQSIENLYVAIGDKKQKLSFYLKRVENCGILKSNANVILCILIQNSLFGESGLNVQELSEASDLSMSTVRSCLKQLGDRYLLIEYDGNKKLYDCNLDAFSD